MFVGAFVAAAVLLLILVARFVPQLGLPPGHAAWPWIIGAAVLAALVPGVLRSMTRRDELEDAIAVDERLALRDRLSSAISLSHSRDESAFALAAVRDGETLAADRALPERIRRAFAVRWPAYWWVAPVLAVAALVAAQLLPQLDPWSRRRPATDEEVKQVHEAIAREIEPVIKAIEEKPELAAALAPELEKLTKDATLDEKREIDEPRREALRNLTEISEQLEKLLENEQSLTMEALKDQLSGLELPKSPEALKFAEALKRGDFALAKKALESLQNDIQQGKLTEEQKEALAKALEQMAEDLAKSESDRKAVEQALEQAGLDPQLASNPDALKQALENSQRLTEAQRQALQKAAQCQQGAAQMRKELSQQMAKMASQCKGGQQGEGGQCGAGMGDMLSDLEMKQALMMQAKAAANACKGGKAGLCSGMGAGSCSGGGINNGMTNSGGIGGGWRPEMPNATKSKIEQAKGNDSNADVIAREFIEGTPTVGQSEAVLRSIDALTSSSAEEGTDDDPTPPHLAAVHKHYFGQLQKQVEARRNAAKKSGSDSGASESPAPDAAPPKSTAPAAPAKPGTAAPPAAPAP